MHNYNPEKAKFINRLCEQTGVSRFEARQAAEESEYNYMKALSLLFSLSKAKARSDG